jgi:hypothetical protein
MPNKVNNNKPKLNNAARARMNARRRALYNAKKANNSLVGIFRGLALRG